MEQNFKTNTITVVTANDGYVFTNKEKTVIYGKELSLPQGKSIEDFYTITDEEHRLFLKNEKWKSWGHEVDQENADYLQWINS